MSAVAGNMTMPTTMQGVVYDGRPYKVAVVDLPVPTLVAETDAVIRIKTAGICGTDLHMYHGLRGAGAPWGLGHEALGYVSQLGSAVSSLKVGDYVVIPDNIANGHLDMEPSTVDVFGVGRGLSGLQAEYARVPFADESLIPIPLTGSTTNLSAEMDYMALSDIFATGWQVLDFAGFLPGDSVAVFGAGPVGLLAAHSAIIRGASKVYVVDRIAMRLERARDLGATAIDFSKADAVDQILAHEPLGVRRVVDCVGMEAVDAQGNADQDLVTRSMVRLAAQHGGLGQVGVYGAQNVTPAAPRASTISPDIQFPLSDFFMKGLSLKSGIVDPKLMAPQLLPLIEQGRARPGFIASAVIPITDAPEYYRRFSDHEEIKVYIHFEDAQSSQNERTIE